MFWIYIDTQCFKLTYFINNNNGLSFALYKYLLIHILWPSGGFRLYICMQCRYCSVLQTEYCSTSLSNNSLVLMMMIWHGWYRLNSQLWYDISVITVSSVQGQLRSAEVSRGQPGSAVCGLRPGTVRNTFFLTASFFPQQPRTYSDACARTDRGWKSH